MSDEEAMKLYCACCTVIAAIDDLETDSHDPVPFWAVRELQDELKSALPQEEEAQ